MYLLAYRCSYRKFSKSCQRRLEARLLKVWIHTTSNLKGIYSGSSTISGSNILGECKAFVGRGMKGSGIHSACCLKDTILSQVTSHVLHELV